MPISYVDRMFYQPSTEVFGDPSEFDLVFEPVTFDGSAGRLHGWFFPAKGPARGTIVHCHGNGGNITGHFKFVAWMPPAGWNVLCFDYRGFGASQGSPSRNGTIEDARAAIQYAHARADVTKVALFGQSLGGAVAIVAAATENSVEAIIVEGAFAEYQSAARFFCKHSLLLWGAAPLTRWLVSPGSDPIDFVGKIAPTPIFFIAGTDDTVCDHRQMVALHAAAGEPKSLWIIEGGGHIGAVGHTDGVGIQRIDQFLTDHIT